MKRTCAILVMVLTIAVLIHSASLAWVSDNGLSSLISISGAVHKNYFEYGEGTVDKPYGIATPGQLYYFAWLQYLGFFNVDKDGDDYLDTFYFELSDRYLENGVLDMDGYTLPPIGTVNNPFIGNFNGKGVTISNLTVKNSYGALSAPPSGTSTDSFGGADIIGFFGVVGSLPGDTTYQYYSDTNEIKNLALSNLTIHTQSEKNTLIGIVAGYVNGNVNGVGVIGSTITIKEGLLPLGPLDQDNNIKNLSDYSLIGYCTEKYRKNVQTLNLSLGLPGETDEPYNLVPEMTGEGQQQGWGGSVKMSDIYTWLKSLNDSSSTASGYTTERVDVVDLSGKRVTVNSTKESRKVATIEGFGSFVFTNVSRVTYVNFVSGAQNVTQFQYVETENNAQLYYITDGTNYISLNGTTVTNTTNQANATKWYVSNGANGGNVYTVVDGIVYYLTINGNNVATVTINSTNYTLLDNLPTWTIVDGDLRCNSQKVECNNGTWRVATASSYYITYNSNGTVHYLTINNNRNGVTDTTNSSNATKWQINTTGTTTTISTVVRVNNQDRTYYLNLTSSGNTYSLSVAYNSTQTTWNYNATNGRFYSNNRYIRYNNGWTTTGTSTNTGTNLTLVGAAYANTTTKTLLQSSGTTAKEIVCQQSTFIDNDTVNATYDTNGNKQGTTAGITYFPLSSTVAGGKYSVDSNNTGYVIGAEWDANTATDTQDGYDSNLRISRYTYQNAGMDLAAASAPYAISYRTENQYELIDSDKYGDASYLKTVLGLTKFANCYGEYLDSVNDGALNGLHFMNAPVTIDNITTITANLNGKEIDNYQVPTNCIDFNLYERGFINAFAGSYYSQMGGSANNSFFSIYQIIREPIDENDKENRKIKEIKEIKEIYGVVNKTTKELDTSQEYIYLYTDGTTSKPIPSGYEMVFNCEWISYTSKFTGWAEKRAFYFEVPVNEGEYAIGSTQRTDGSIAVGAYLVYLDLAANAQLINRDKTCENITESSASSTIPNGVELIDPDTGFNSSTINPFNSAFVEINSGTSGSIKYDKNGNVISHTATGGTTAEYVNVNGTLVDANGNAMTVPWDSVTKIIRTTYRDHNINTGVITVTVIDEIVAEVNGVKTTKFTKDVTITYPEGHKDYPDGYVDVKPTVGPQDDRLYPETKDAADSPTVSAGTAPLIDITFSCFSDAGLTTSYLYTPGEKDEGGNVITAPKYVITILNGGEVAVDVKAVLTDLGKTCNITFVISDGTTENILTKTTEAQFITINPSATGGESGGEGGEGGQTP